MRVAERVADVLGGFDGSPLPGCVPGRISTGWCVRACRSGRCSSSPSGRLPPALPASALVYAIVPSATFKRRTRLSPDESARTERLARVIALVEEMAGDADAAREFLNRPHPLLEHETPLAVAHTELGARRVENLLYSIEHGLPL